MVANLNGIAFEQFYGDNTAQSGETEFDTDGDGTATQEDEFVSFTNTSGVPVDISGWQIWSDSTGSNAPDQAQDGLYHTFPPGTVIQPGGSLWVVNEISNPDGLYFAQEASSGGVESGAGGVSTNWLSEGNAGSPEEAVFLVDPATGNYITFNMSSAPPNPSKLAGFTGTNQVGLVDGHAVMEDQDSGQSIQYDRQSDSYTAQAAFVPCFARGTRIATPDGERAIEHLSPGDSVLTLSGAPARVRAVLSRHVNFRGGDTENHRPILFAPGSLGANAPVRPLAVSPQHRMLVTSRSGEAVLVPAKALLHRPGVRRKRGLKEVRYIHLLLERHEVILADGAPAESFWPGAYGRRCLARHLRRLPDWQARPADPGALRTLTLREAAETLT